MEASLNIDIAGKVTEFEHILRKLIPKQIFNKLFLLGKGLEFDSFRNFTPNDDASLIDWKASAKANTLFVRKYVEERESRVMILLDVSESMVFGSTEKLKCEYSAELIAALTHLLLNTGEKCGFAFFNDHLFDVNLPMFDMKIFKILMNYISSPANYGGSQDISKSLKEFIDMLNPEISMVIIISDFNRVKEGDRQLFRELGSAVETICLVVKDPLDVTLPDINKEVLIQDPETGEKFLLNPSIARVSYEKNTRKHFELVSSIFEESNIDSLELSTERSFSLDLANFLKQRSIRRVY